MINHARFKCKVVGLSFASLIGLNYAEATAQTYEAGWGWGNFGVEGTSTDPVVACKEQVKRASTGIINPAPSTGENIFDNKIRLGKIFEFNPISPICGFHNTTVGPNGDYERPGSREIQIFWWCASGQSEDKSGNCVDNNDSTVPPPPIQCDIKSRSPAVGDPISITTGDVFEEVVDFETEGPIPLQLKRLYRSRTKPGYNFGTSRWRYDFEYNFSSSDYGVYVVTTPEGEQYYFNKNSDGTYTNQDSQSLVSVAFDQVNSLSVDFKDGRKAEFYRIDVGSNGVSTWRPLKIYKQNGQVLTLKYYGYKVYDLTSIQDQFGRTINFNIPDGAISVDTAIYKASPNSAPSFKIKYEYQSSALSNTVYSAVLSKATRYKTSNDGSDWTEVNHVTYLSEDPKQPSLMTGLIDERGIRVSSWTYDSIGRGTSSQNPGGLNLETVSYDNTTGNIVDTNPLGLKTTYSTSSFKNSRVSGNTSSAAAANVPASSSSVEFDVNGTVAKRFDQEGRLTTYARDSAGRPTQIITGSSNSISTVSIDYDQNFDLPAQIKQDGLTTKFTYNSFGQKLTVTQLDTTTQSIPFSTNGRSRVWTYTYNSNGLLSSIDGPLPGSGDTTSFTYNSNGFVQSITNPVGQTTTTTAWNYRGQPTAITSPNGLVTTYTYDDMGRPLSVTAAYADNPTVWSMTYNSAGDVATYTDPGGAVLTLTWDDGRRLMKIQNNLGEVISYTRDAMGNETARTIAGADGTVMFTQSSMLDELGRLIKQVGGENRTWSLSYDKTSNLTGLTDPRYHTLNFGFDAVNRLISETQRDGGVIKHSYNGKNEENAYTDPRNLSTSYVRNGFGEIIQETSPERGNIVYDYDERGLLTAKQDARGTVTYYSYDLSGRPTGKYYTNNSINEIFSYDDTSGGSNGTGQLTRMIDPSGYTSYTYDKAGRVISEYKAINSVSFSTSYTYAANGSGLLNYVTYPSGHVVIYGYDGVGRVNYIGVQLSSNNFQNILNWAGYYPFSGLQGLAFANGLTAWSTRDKEYNSSTLQLLSGSGGPNLIDRSFSFGDNSNITKIDNDNLDANLTQLFSYDDENRLLFGSGPFGSRTYTYDTVGNRLSETATISGSTITKNYTYPTTSNQLSVIKQGNSPTRTFSYDAAGNQTSDIRSGLTYAYSINDAGRISQLSVGGTVNANYIYDGRNRLVIRETVNTSPSGKTYLLYDLSNHLISESDSSGNVIREYVWLDDTPIAVIDNSSDPLNPTLLWVHVDHVGRPEMMTDATQVVKWKAVYEPFGTVSSITGAASLQMRFPGQWFQLETGLAYNWYRHYDSTTGRYTQADTLGKADGPDTYGYAHANPLLFTDYSGQFVVALPYVFVALGSTAAAVEAYIITDQIKAALKGLYDPLNARKSDKEASTDTPSWAKGLKPKEGQSGKDFAAEVCDNRFGKGNYDTGPTSDYNRLKKYGDRRRK